MCVCVTSSVHILSLGVVHARHYYPRRDILQQPVCVPPFGASNFPPDRLRTPHPSPLRSFFLRSGPTPESIPPAKTGGGPPRRLSTPPLTFLTL